MRTNRQPRLADSAGVSISCIGDVHFAPGGVYDARVAMVVADLHTMIGHTTLDAVVQLGDQTSEADDASFTPYLTWRATMSDLGIPVGEVPGNHDIIGGNASGTPDIKTPAQWATIMGQASKDRVIDLVGVRLLLVAPAADGTTGEANIRRLTVDPTTRTWIMARCAETTSQVVIFFHAPLLDTVGPLDGTSNSSYDERWRAHWDTGYALDTMIAACPNIAAWVSGHTHSRVTEVDAVKSVTYGSVTFAAVSVSSPAFLSPGVGAGEDQVATCLLTVRPDRVEVRYRDHGMHQWLAPVSTVTL